MSSLNDNAEKLADSNGRTRQFPHVDGNFATSVRIQCRLTTREKRTLSDVVREIQRQLFSTTTTTTTTTLVAESEDANDEEEEEKTRETTTKTKKRTKTLKLREMDSNKDVHVSLSRVFPMQKEQREPYRSQLKRSLGEKIARRRGGGNASDSDDLALNFRELRVFVNDEKTTTFVALCEKDGDDASLRNGSGRVREMISAVNEVNERFGFPKYEYEPCVIPHASFCYADGDWEREMNAAVEAVTKKREELANNASVDITCKTDNVDLCISGWEPKKVFSSESLPPPPI
jgi:hypothetical protein